MQHAQEHAITDELLRDSDARTPNADTGVDQWSSGVGLVFLCFLGEELETVRGECVFMCVPPGRPPGVAVSPYRSRLPPVSAYRYCTLGTETTYSSHECGCVQ